MSYARFSEGDVYVFPSGDGIECLQCQLDPDISMWNGRVDFTLNSGACRWVANGEDHRTNVVNTLVHLAQHERAGDRVPNRAWDLLHLELTTGELA